MVSSSEGMMTPNSQRLSKYVFLKTCRDLTEMVFLEIEKLPSR